MNAPTIIDGTLILKIFLMPIIYLSFHNLGSMQSKNFLKYVERWNYVEEKHKLTLNIAENTT